MTDNNRYFHFTIGPVQGFVAQARRTRDFWAGSFLLSWLAGVAICAVKTQGGKIVFPVPNDDFLKALEGKKVDKLPKQGGIPNRFMADINDCPNFSGSAVVEAVQQAWKAIADAVYKKDKQGLEQSYHTKKIWERQIAQFWDMSWVITQGRDTSALDKRKNFRTHVPSVEDGYKCMVMDGFQELSGASDKHSGKKRREYWTTLSCHIHSKDIDEREELCAIAYVKRRFVHVFKDVKTELTVNGNSLTIHGWKLPHNVPSVAYMAAVPWLKSILQSSDEEMKETYRYFISVLSEMSYMTKADIANQTERRNHVKFVQEKIDDNISLAEDISLDGNVYYLNYWNNLNNFVGDKQNYDGQIDKYRPKVKTALSKLYKSMNDFEPSPYYAILLMDGDSLGKQMSHEKRQPVISQALDDFTQQAEKIVHENDGFLIYAGGDDVLALLSLDDAMKTANQLREAYVKCFENAPNKVKAEKPECDVENVYSTLSGAINYCHINTPLTQVLKDSHQLLDDIAKDGTGRNALAVRVHKPSGQAVQWSLPWDKVMDASQIDKINKNFNLSLPAETPVIEALALAMAGQKSSDKNTSIFSSGFFYKTRHLMEMLEQMMTDGHLTVAHASKLLLAEYLQSGQFRKIEEQEQKKLLVAFDILIEQSKDYKSQIDDGRASIDKNSGQKLSGDAGILLRILGQKGLGRGDKA